MSPQEIMSKYGNIVVVNSERTALAMGLNFKKRTEEQQRAAFGGDFRSGFFYMTDDPAYPDTIYECVVSPAGDAIVSLYKGHPMFNSIGDLARARHTITLALAEKVGLSREAIGIDDPGRGRSLGLNELSTGQLIDLLAERMGSSIVVTNSMSAEGAGGIVLPH